MDESVIDASDKAIFILKCPTSVMTNVNPRFAQNYPVTYSYRFKLAEKDNYADIWYDDIEDDFRDQPDPYAVTDLFRGVNNWFSEYELPDYFKVLEKLCDENPNAPIYLLECTVPYNDIPSFKQ